MKPPLDETRKSHPRHFGRAVLNLALVLSIFLLRGCVFRPATVYPGSHFNRGKNAVWIGVEWVNEAHTVQEIAALALDLKQKQMAYVYPYISYLHPDGNFGTSYSYAADFVRLFKQSQPQIKLLAWIGLPLDYVNLGDPTVRHKIAQFCADLVQKYGFDGIHLDPEIIFDGDQTVLTLLDDTRTAIGPGKILSIATHKIWPLFPDTMAQKAGPQLWSAHYYHELSKHVDQIAVMTYDSSLTSPILYRLWSRFQVIQISKAVAGTGTELLFGVPTSEEESITHHAFAENMTSGLSGIVDGLNDDETPSDAVTGVAIYPYWDTDLAEWAIYETLWLSS